MNRMNFVWVEFGILSSVTWVCEYCHTLCTIKFFLHAYKESSRHVLHLLDLWEHWKERKMEKKLETGWKRSVALFCIYRCQTFRSIYPYMLGLRCIQGISLSSLTKPNTLLDWMTGWWKREIVHDTRFFYNITQGITYVLPHSPS